MVVMPAGHLVQDMEAFSQAVKQAEKLAAQGKLVTFGLKPSALETGYGYILSNGIKVERSVEKPDKEAAEKYIADGNYFWNSGMFYMHAGSFLEELDLLAPDIAAQAAKAVARANNSLQIIGRRLKCSVLTLSILKAFLLIMLCLRNLKM